MVYCASLSNAFSSRCSFYDRHADYSVTTAGVEIASQALGGIVLDVGGNSGQDIEVLTPDSLRYQRIAQDRYTAQMLRLDSEGREVVGNGLCKSVVRESYFASQTRSSRLSCIERDQH